jgi:hypothetical protein
MANPKELETLKNSFLMYENTRKQTEKNMKTALNPDGTKKYDKEKIDAELALIDEAENEVIQKYVLAGGNADDLKKKRRKTTKTVDNNNDLTINEMIEANRNDAQPIITTETVIEKDFSSSKFEYNPQAAYDVIPLPSKGECYKNKMSKIPVGYLTAYDENMIIAPNLYKDNKIIDTMLREKVLNSTVDVEDMLEGDREAIILFLRASGYGNEYPITATDNATNVSFETYVDLSKLKFKEFKLKGDVNGWFEYTLPICGKTVKFKFLTHRDIENLNRLEELEEAKLRKDKLREIVSTMDDYVENDKNLEQKERVLIRKAIRDIEKWEEGMDDDTLLYTHTVTNRLELSIMEVDGVTDRRIIRDFVRNMNVKDSSALRKYIRDNEPGIDYNIEIEKPESLGGGTMNVFLQLDQYIFLNVAE